MIPWFSITFAGSFTVMTSAALAIAGWLTLNREFRLLVWWSLLFFGGMLLVVVTKIAFIGWGIGIKSLDFTGFSGHAMRATSVAPVLLYMLFNNYWAKNRILAIFAGLAFGMLIGLSRLAVHAHSVSEVIAGCLLGAAVSLTFITLLSKASRIHMSAWVVAISLIGLFATPNIAPVPTQRWITDVALYISGHNYPYIRATWRMSASRPRLEPSD